MRRYGLSESLGADAVLLGSQVAFQQSLRQRQTARTGNMTEAPTLCPAGHCPTLSLSDQSPSPKLKGGEAASSNRQSPSHSSSRLGGA